jgi:hypothetical protein
MLTRILLILFATLLALPLAAADIVSPVEAKKRPRTVTRTFRNISPIIFPFADAHPASAENYPSPIKEEAVGPAHEDEPLARAQFPRAGRRRMSRLCPIRQSAVS